MSESWPETVRIGYRDYRVERWDHTEAMRAGNFGECDHAKGVLRIDGGLDAQQAAETMMHEMLHAVFSCFGYADWAKAEDPEEAAVTILAKGLSCTTRDNPELWAQISKALGAAADV